MPENKISVDFLHACENGDKHSIQSMLKGGKIKVNHSDDDGHTGLQVAAANDQVSLGTVYSMRYLVNL